MNEMQIIRIVQHAASKPYCTIYSQPVRVIRTKKFVERGGENNAEITHKLNENKEYRTRKFSNLSQN